MGKRIATNIPKRISWISRTICNASAFLNCGPLTSSIILFGILPWIPLNLVLVFSNYLPILVKIFNGSTPLHLSLPAVLAYTWLFYGPRLIYYYEIELLPNVIKKAGPLLSKEDYEYFVKIPSEFQRITNTVCPIFILLALLMGYIVYPYAKYYFYVSSIFHPYYIASVILMIFLAYIASFGVSGVILCLKVTRKLYSVNVKLDLSDPTEMGGLGFVMDFAIKTTINFASGFSVIPFLYNLSIWISGLGQIIGLLLVVFYLSLVTASFGIPVYCTYKAIRRKKELLLRKHLSYLVEKYNNLLDTSDDSIPINQAEINLSMWYIQRLKSIKGVPIDNATILQFCGLILVPLIVTYVQYQAGK